MPSKQGYALLEKHFPKGSLAPTTVLARLKTGSPEFTQNGIPNAILRVPGGVAAFFTGLSPDGKWQSYQVILKGDPYSKEALQQVREIRQAARQTAAKVGGVALVGGSTAIQADTWALSNRDTIFVAVVALVVGVILAVLLRALVAALYLLATNLLSYLAALGATILITEKLLGWERISSIVSYTYQPKFPKAKLHEIVTKYEAVMQTLGKAPNCSIAFVGADGSVSPVHVRGWLLKDPSPQASGRRYVLLTDGDVWREVEPPAGAGQDPHDPRIWLNGPDDDLVTLLARSQANARTGGSGFLEGEEHVELDPHVVADRREDQYPHEGPERRSDS